MKEDIIGLDHIAVICSEKEATLRFYKALGFYLTEEILRPERNDEICFMSGYGITLEIFVKKDSPKRLNYPEAFGLRHIALKCAKGSIQKLLDILKLEGYQSDGVKTDGLNKKEMAFINDPDGLPIELHE